MTIKEFYDRLYKINKYLTIVKKGSKPVRIFFSDYHAGNPEIYNFETGEYNLPNCDKYLSNDMEDVADLIDAYNYDSNDSQKTSKDSESKNGLTKDFHLFASKDFQKESNNLYTKSTVNALFEDWVNNPFRSYTEKLAETLQEKNKAYGDSFTKSVDDYGLKVIGIRLSDKYNRIKHLVNNSELKENDESLEDTLLDMAGYSILALKYLEEHRDD